MVRCLDRCLVSIVTLTLVSSLLSCDWSHWWNREILCWRGESCFRDKNPVGNQANYHGAATLPGLEPWRCCPQVVICLSVCPQLARRGFAMMLISRSQEKLDDVARTLRKWPELLTFQGWAWLCRENGCMLLPRFWASFSLRFLNSFLHVFKAVSASTEELYNVETKTIAVDFGKSNIYCRIEEALAGLEVGVLGKDTSSFKLSLWVKFLFLFLFFF